MENQGAFYTGIYRNLFGELGHSDDEINKKIEKTFNAMFVDDSSRIYFDCGEDMGYVLDTGNDDVRTEGMSYGMMMAVQLNRKDIFDRIWKWAKTYMYIDSGINSGYFAWSVHPDGSKNSMGPAPDGEEYFAMALLFASHRWGDGNPPFDYSKEALKLLSDVIHKGEKEAGFPMWNRDNKLILFVPGAPFSDPSYHLPHFYELFSRWGNAEDRYFWREASQASRIYIEKSCDQKTGLCAEYAEFDGTPRTNEGHGYYYSDAYRVAGNIALDSVWFGRKDWQTKIANNLQTFFGSHSVGIDTFMTYKCDGTVVDQKALHPYGLLAMLAMASLVGDTKYAKAFAEDFWKLELRDGKRRYYDNCLYLFSLLALSGNYRIY